MTAKRLMTHKQKGKIVRAMLLAAAFSAATFMGTSASAQAAWGPPKDNLAGATCTNYGQIVGLLFQECIVVAYHTNGASVQSILRVSNTTSGDRRVRGETHTYIDGGYELSFTNCGDRVIRAGTRQWCWGVTKPVSGHAHPVYGIGYLYDYKYGGRGIARSPTKLT